jgi:hypothetical protein
MKRLLRVLRGRRAGKGSSEPEFARLKLAVVSDELTRATLAHECRVRDLTPLNYKVLLRYWRPDLVFVESAWHGPRKAWKFKIAAYPDYPERNNAALRRVIGHARDLGIPCVFWNKEDGVHFDRFIESACLFDTVFTVDENCIPKYRQRMGSEAKILPLMFAVQPAIHHPNARGPIHQEACFVGSYSHHIHDSRRGWQDMMFAAASDFGVAVFDRNSVAKVGQLSLSADALAGGAQERAARRDRRDLSRLHGFAQREYRAGLRDDVLASVGGDPRLWWRRGDQPCCVGRSLFSRVL